MGDVRVSPRIYCVLFCTIIKAVISTGLGKCPVYPTLPNFDLQRVSLNTTKRLNMHKTSIQEKANLKQSLEIKPYTNTSDQRGTVGQIVSYCGGGSSPTVMTGTWFEVERSFYLVELTSSCTELTVNLNDRGYLLITINTVNKWTGNPSTTNGLGIPSYNGSSIFRYKVNNRVPYVIGRLLPGAGLYNILFTDYDGFAIIWSCTSLSVAHSDHIWVLGRRREIEASVRVRIYAIMQELGLDPDRLIISKNTNCVTIN